MLQHEWVREGGVAGDNIIVPEVLSRLREFASLNKLKKLALLMIAQRLPGDEVAGLKELFASMDLDGDGSITVQELSTVLSSKGAKLPQEEIEQLMALADMNGNKSLDYLEFVGAAMHVHKLQQEEYLIEVFRAFDEDNSGFISREELEHALKKGSSKFSNQELQQDIAKVLLECDQDKDGRIDYAEFVSMMLPKDEVSQSKAATFAAHYAQQQKQQQQQLLQKAAVIRADAEGVVDQTA
jgi:calcium-dependent protein kinase